MRRGPRRPAGLAPPQRRGRRRLHRRPARRRRQPPCCAPCALLRDLDIGVSSGNHEFDGSQFEINLTHSHAMDAAGRAFRFKAAVKELAASKAGWPPSWRSHRSNDTRVARASTCTCPASTAKAQHLQDPSAPHSLSATARHAIAGILAHAPALTALASPTVDSYSASAPTPSPPG
ncbi:hypothetical protein [Streptomyces sp. KL116D]|uniref:hypothetical protein n=1 Tax=Streptomyces sp. KL116D TaxID=3045152 RepID=UPI003558D146